MFYAWVPTIAQQTPMGLYERYMFEEAVQTRIHLFVMSTLLIYFLPYILHRGSGLNYWSYLKFSKIGRTGRWDSLYRKIRQSILRVDYLLPTKVSTINAIYTKTTLRMICNFIFLHLRPHLQHWFCTFSINLTLYIQKLYWNVGI